MNENLETRTSSTTTAAKAEPNRPRFDETREYDVQQLFQGDNRILIRFGPSQYEMRITKKGKLILTK